jgi:SET domain-containing protein
MPSRSSKSTSSRPFELRASAIQGKGAFALRRIRAGTRLIEYTGRRISQDEANTRFDDEAMGRHHTFLFSLDDNTCLDASEGGNDSRFFNHSCEPNCEAVLEDGRIFLYTLRDIWPGEELVYDYAYERSGDMSREAERLYFCQCGSPFCRGTILAPPKEPKRSPAKRRASPALGTGRRTSPAPGTKGRASRASGTRRAR